MSVSPPTTGAREFALGWPVILGAILCYALSVVAVPIYTNGVFLVELQKEFGWSRAQISLGGTLQTLTLAVMSPVVGLIADRFGMRLPIAVSLVGFALFYALLGLVLNSYAGFLLLQVLLSLLGAATLPVLFTRAVNSWFDRARGLALGTTLTGTGLTATFAPSFVAYWIGQGGWRTAYLAIAVVVLVAAPLIVWLVKLAPWDRPAEAAAPPVSGLTVAEAIRRPVFWWLGGAFLLQSLALLGMIGHMVPLLTDAGLERMQAAELAGIVGLAIIAGRFFVGAIIDHVFAPWVAAAVTALSAGGCVALATGGLAWAPFAAFAIGFAIGGEIDIIGFLASRYFGLLAYARIYGLLYGIFLLGTALSPLWIALVFDHAGSYAPALLTSALLMAGSIVILLFLPRYQAPTTNTLPVQEPA